MDEEIYEELSINEEENTTGGSSNYYATYYLTKSGKGTQEILQTIPVKCGLIKGVKILSRTHTSLGVSYSSSCVKAYRGTQKGTIRFEVTGSRNHMIVTYTFK